MSQIVSLADTGSNPAVHPNLCFGGENGYITQRYERWGRGSIPRWSTILMAYSTTS